jgi:hypothetical protein
MYGHYQVMKLKNGFTERRNGEMWWIIGCSLWIFLAILIICFMAGADALGGVREDAIDDYINFGYIEENITSGCPVNNED